MRQVYFYYDLVCPWAYIASKRIEALCERVHAQLTWKPVLLGGVYDLTNAPQGKANSASSVMVPSKQAYQLVHLERTLQHYGLRLTYPPKTPASSLLALRLLCSVSDEQRGPLSHALFKAYWQQGLDISNPSVLSALAQETIGEVIKKIDQDLLRENTSEVVERGAPGVPAFWLPEFKKLYWGQDRLHFLEAHLLAGASLSSLAGMEKVDLKKIWSSPTTSPPSTAASSKGKKLYFWFDTSSPWGYLGWSQLARLRSETGCEVILKPIFLGMLFKLMGTATLPMNAMSVNRQSYFMQDLQDWKDWWAAFNGKPVKFTWPDIFPIRTVNAQRVIILEPATIDCIYEACWANNENISNDQVLEQVLARNGFNPNLLQAAKNNERGCKDILKANTDEALARGVFGVPTFQVGSSDSPLYFGQDNYHWIQQELSNGALVAHL